ncbi:hypothetical protein T4E_10851 [Trichinella pseudospiralis]|uniref:Uncharacterized protein n=1 Tax=Trichinella pseudospiralis TaxID=6337 RepID=A0A0V0XW36_TRIPS|nr:hypothetical protein T4E_10851 [Trichinella pseudospiralis]
MCTDGDIVFNTVSGHVIMIDTEGGCDRLSDAIWLVRCLFSNVRPRLSLSSMVLFLISFFFAFITYRLHFQNENQKKEIWLY